MNASKHHVGEWDTAVVVVALPNGMVANIPLVARDVQGANKCVRFSLWLLGYPFVRTGVEHGGDVDAA